LRIRVNISAIGSVMNINSVSLPIIRLAGETDHAPTVTAKSLPARLNNAWDLPLQRQLTKTDAAQVELPQVASRAAAPLAASIGTNRKFRPA